MGGAIDQVQLNFNPQAQMGLNVVLALVMFGIALDLKTWPTSRPRCARRKALAIGHGLSHHLLFPAFTFLPDPADQAPAVHRSWACCWCRPARPGTSPTSSPTASGGNAALSVSISTLSTVGAMFLTPLNVTFWGSLDPADERAAAFSFSLDPAAHADRGVDVARLAAGRRACSSRTASRDFAQARCTRPMRVLLAAGASSASWSVRWCMNWSDLPASTAASSIALVVFVHNALALAGGYGLARASRAGPNATAGRWPSRPASRTPAWAWCWSSTSSAGWAAWPSSPPGGASGTFIAGLTLSTCGCGAIQRPQREPRDGRAGAGHRRRWLPGQPGGGRVDARRGQRLRGLARRARHAHRAAPAQRGYASAGHPRRRPRAVAA